MEDFEFGRLAYLGVLLVAVVFWFITNHRESFGKTVQQALAWGLIFLGVIGAVAMWEDIKSAAMPTSSVMMDGDRIEIPRSPDGHYHVTALVNGVNVPFIVDTGASDVVLSKKDAERVGLDPENLPYFGRAQTANGLVETAPVQLDTLSLGGMEAKNVSASVNGGELHKSLLGMSYLQRFQQITITNGRLVLTP